MQRNRTYQTPLKALVQLALFVVYEALSMHYLFLPPLLGVLLFYFIRALDRQDSILFFQLVAMLLVYETARGYWVFSTFSFFVLSYFLLLPKVRSAISCEPCRNVVIVLYAYLGLWLFQFTMAHMFAFDLPQLDLNLLLYLTAEILLVNLL